MIALLFCGVVFVIYYFYYQNKIKHIKIYSGPSQNLIFGNTLDFLDRTKYLEKLLEYRKKYGKIIRVQVGPLKQVLIVSDYKFFEFILSSQKTIEKSSQYDFLHNWLGTGLLTSGGNKWNKRRKTLTPAFHFSILEQFVTTFESVGEILVKKLENELDNNGFDIYPYITLSTLDVICEASMGVSVNAQICKDSDYVKSVKTMGTVFVNRLFSAIKSNDFLYRFTLEYYTERKALKVLHSFSESVIDKKLKSVESNEDDEHLTDEFGRKKKLAFLDLLLKCTIDGKPLSREDLREEVDTFMFEGHDTTGSAITFILYSLANHYEVQKKAFEEQIDLFGDKNLNKSCPSFNDLQNMKYLELVIKESLRLYPSVPFFGRELYEDLEYNGNILPKGLSIMIFAFAIQRDSEYFEEPELFKPERFENKNAKFNFSYVPFSAGPRNCIGQKFAMLEMKSIVSKIIRHYELFPALNHELKLNSETILISKTGVHISMKKRQYTV